MKARRGLAVATALGLIATAVVLVELASSVSPASADVGTFTNTSLCYDTYTVPAGATTLTAVANGAPGSPGKPADNGVPGGAGGFGRELNTTLDVTPGSTLYVGMSTTGIRSGGGGFAWGPDETNFRGGAGGGAAWVSTTVPGTGCTVSNPLLVASGGGGGGGGGRNRNQGGFGGAGGSEGINSGNGSPGQDTTSKLAALDDESGSGGGGTGATTTANGSGGVGGNREVGSVGIPPTICSDGFEGDDGTPVEGGRGGTASGDPASASGSGLLVCDAFGGGGGGGGGGYRGGGGGGGGNAAGRDGGGGGAGSSYTAPGVSLNSSDVGCFRQAGNCMLEKPAGVVLTPVNTAPVITTGSSTTASPGVYTSFQVVTTGYRAPSLSISGAPSWITFSDFGNAKGRIDIDPPQNVPGGYSVPFQLRASNSSGTATQTFTVNVLGPPRITSANRATFLAGSPNTFTITAPGFPQPTISRTGPDLPGWLSFTDNGNGTATLSGTPPTNGPVSTVSFSITATNSQGAATPQPFTLTALNSIIVTPTNPLTSLAVNSVAFTATGLYPNGATVDVTQSSSWSSSNAGVARALGQGFVSPESAGTATITATNGPVSDTAVLTVRGDRPTSISVSPASLIAVPGGSLQYTATGHYGSSPTTADLTGVVGWSSSAANIVSPQSGGVFRFVRAGTATLTASLPAATGSPLTATAGVTVKNPSSMAVTAPSPTVDLAATMQMVATATFADNTTADVSKSAVWFTEFTNEVRLSSNGVVTGRMPGLATIVATAYPADLAPVIGSKSIEVVYGTPTSITMATSSASNIQTYTAALGDTLPRFSAIAHYAGELGLTQDIRAAAGTTWESSDPTVATVDTGFVTQRAVGVTTITARNGSNSASFVLTLTQGDPQSITIDQANTADTMVSPGGTLQLTVKANYLGGTEADVTHDGNLRWSADTPTVADVSSSGLVTMKGLQDRSVGRIRAEFLKADGVSVAASDFADMTVVLDRPNALTITPATATMEAGTSRSFIATGTYENGVTADATRAQNIQWQVWERGDLGSVSSTGVVSTAPLNAQGATLGGDMEIRATLGTEQSFATITIPARKGNPASIELTTCAVGAPAADCDLDVAAGTTRQLTATATYSDNSTADVTDQVIWTSFNTSKATVSSTGLVTALVAGSALIDATFLKPNGSFCCADNVSLNITLGTPQSLSMAPLTPSVAKNGTVRFTAHATYRGNIVQEVTNTATWSSSDTAKVDFLDSTNRSVATGRNPGTSTVTASFGGLTASTLMNVTNTDPQILLVYDTEAPASDGAFCQVRVFSSDACNTIFASQVFAAGQTRRYRVMGRWTDDGGATPDTDVTAKVGFSSGTTTSPGNVQPTPINPLPLVSSSQYYLSGGELTGGHFFESRTETIRMCLVRSDGQCWGAGNFQVSVGPSTPVSVRITLPSGPVPPEGPPPDVVTIKNRHEFLDVWGKLADGKEAEINTTLTGQTWTTSDNRTDGNPVVFALEGGHLLSSVFAGVSFVTARAGDATATVRVTVAHTLQAPDFTAKTPPLTATTGTPYSYQFRAKPAALDEAGQPVVGGREATYAVNTGTLPPGLSLDTATGVLSGTPTTVGSFTFKIGAVNGGGLPKDTGDITVVVSDPPDTAPAFTAASPPATGTVGAAYGPYTFTASGYPAPTLSVDSGVLPPGLAFDASTNRLAGTPTADGTFTFRMTAANGVDPPATTPDITVTVAPAPVAPEFTDSSPPPGVVDAPYSYQFAASGLPAPTFSVSDGTLPTGLALDATTGVLSGTPTATGNFTFAVDAANSAGTATSDATSIVIVSAPVFTAASPPSPAAYASPYSYTFEASGNPAPTFFLASGSLPSGLSVDTATGELSGTPTETGSFTFQIGADTSPSTPDAVTDPLTLVVDPATLTITAGSPASITYGDATPSVGPSFSGFVNGDTAPAVPPTCAAQIDGSHLRNAKPVAGTYVTACSGASDPNYEIAYVAGSLTVDPLGVIVTASSPAAITYGAATSTVTPNYATFVNGDTPADLTTAPTCGAGPSATLRNGKLVPGTQPTACAGAVSPNYGFTYVEGAVQVGRAPLTITAEDQARSTTQTDPAFTWTANFVNGDTASALTRPPTCSVAAPNTTTPGAYDITCSGAVSDLYNPISYATGTLTVTSSPVFTAAAPPKAATYGSPYAGYTFAASGAPTFAIASGALPPGLSLDPTTGALSGTPTAVGAFDFGVSASNGISPDAFVSPLTITVGPAPMTITASSPAAITYGTVTPPVTPSYSAFVNGDTALATPPTCGAAPEATLRNGKLVPGNQPTACSGAVDPNYEIGYAPGTLQVNKAVLTITADDQSRAAVATNPPLTFTANFLNGDTASALSTQPTCVANDGGTSTPGGYVISCDGAASDFYGPFTYVNGTLRVGSAATTTALVTSPTPTPFGTPVTLTATVAATGSSAIPTGGVLFSVGTVPLGPPVPLDGIGMAQLTLKTVNPGLTITAEYTPADLSFAGSTASVSPPISFTQTFTGKINGTLKLTNGVFLLNGVTIVGKLTVGSGASVVVLNSTIKDNVIVNGANAFSMCGSKSTGTVTVSGARGFVLIGGATDHGCAPNIINGNLALSNNRSSVYVEGNKIGGKLSVEGTTGLGGLPIDIAPKIKANTVQGNLVCTSNTPPPSNDGAPNSVNGRRSGQCAAL